MKKLILLTIGFLFTGGMLHGMEKSKLFGDSLLSPKMLKPKPWPATKYNLDITYTPMKYGISMYDGSARRFAFYMATHPRCGIDSPANVLPTELFKHITMFIPKSGIVFLND